MAYWKRSSQQTRCGQQSTGSSNYHCCSREACWTSWILIDAAKHVPQVSPSSDVTANPSPSAPFCLLKYYSYLVAVKGWNWLGEVKRVDSWRWGWCCVNCELALNDVFVVCYDEIRTSVCIESLFRFHLLYVVIPWAQWTVLSCFDLWWMQLLIVNTTRLVVWMTPFTSSKTNSKPRLPFLSHVFPTFLILCPTWTQYWLLSDKGKGPTVSFTIKLRRSCPRTL